MNKQVFDIFDQICQIPRPSKHEEQISDWLVQFAKEHDIEWERDEANNVFMRVPATPGCENKEGVILQAHMDMVCEKNSDVQHDFMHDPISYYIDGDWMKAHGTTLGADDGIGMSIALAILTNPTLKHPALEALFTIDEETGLTGAEQIKEGYLHGTRLINLDSEDDGQIFIGCAGGIDTTALMHYTPVDYAQCTHDCFAFRVAVKGLIGGHSGDDINKGRACANKLIVNFLHKLSTINYQLSTLQGGNLRNAISREAEAVFAVPAAYKHDVIAAFNGYVAEVEQTFGAIEQEMELTLDSCPMPKTFIPDNQAAALIQALYDCPHGMIAMSKDLPGLVETSTNLASIRMKDGYIEICTSQRSAVEKDKHAIKDRVHAALATACDVVTHGDGYPGWTPNMESSLMEITKQAYIDLFQQEPRVLAIHAGLECGLFLLKYPYLDMVSVGPQMYGVHSPQERISISSTDRCYDWVCHILEML